ncbi:hypothetical protein HDU93_002925, partial [Gonapodya sp. JEL0774]
MRGGALNNAVVDGLVAALELFEKQRRRRPSDPTPTRHVLLIACNPGLYCVAMENLMDEFDGYGLVQIRNHMKQNRIHLSVVLTQRGIQELEELPPLVNKDLIQLRDIKLNPPLQNYVIRMAGFDLPVSKPKTPSATPSFSPTPGSNSRLSRNDATITPGRLHAHALSPSAATVQMLQQTLTGRVNAAQQAGVASMHEEMAATAARAPQRGTGGAVGGVSPLLGTGQAPGPTRLKAPMAANPPVGMSAGGGLHPPVAANPPSMNPTPPEVLWSGELQIGSLSVSVNIIAQGFRDVPKLPFASYGSVSWPRPLVVTGFAGKINSSDMKQLVQSGKFPLLRVFPSKGQDTKLKEALSIRLSSGTAVIKLPGLGKALWLFIAGSQTNSTIIMGCLVPGETPPPVQTNPLAVVNSHITQGGTSGNAQA